MGETGIISTGTSTDLPVPINLEPMAETDRAAFRPKVQKVDGQAAAADLLVSSAGDDLKRLTASLESLGLKLAHLDEHGFLKPDQLDAAKKRIQGHFQSFSAILNTASFLGMDFVQRQVVEMLRSKTDFPLLPLKDQIALLQGEPFKFGEGAASSLKGEQTDRQRFAYAVKLQAEAREDKGGVEDKKDAARLFEKAAEIDPDNLEDHRGAARNLKAWADGEADPTQKQTLYSQALGHLQTVAEKDPKDTKALKLAAEILTNLGKPEDAKLLQTEIFRR